MLITFRITHPRQRGISSQLNLGLIKIYGILSPQLSSRCLSGVEGESRQSGVDYFTKIHSLNPLPHPHRILDVENFKIFDAQLFLYKLIVFQ